METLLLYITNGTEAKRGLEHARGQVATAIGAETKEIYFTACGSESDNLALKGVAYANRQKGNHIITTKIEHPAILQTCQTLEKQGYEVTYLNVDEQGMISLQELEKAIKPTTILISVMFANNEIGTTQPIEEIGKIAKKHGILFHTDSVQAVGNVAIDVQKLQIDLLSMSAHKFYGPKGVGALYVREGVDFERIQDGGHQEKNKRAGTENVAGIVGLGKAIELATQNLIPYCQKLESLKEQYIRQIREKLPEAKLNGHPEKRLAGNVNFSFPHIDGQELLLALDRRGICASTGSACSSGSLNPSHVLLAIGLPREYAEGALRVSIGEENTKEDIDFLVDSIVEIITQMKKLN